MQLSPIATSAGLLFASNVFVPFAILYMKRPPKLDYLRASLCILGAVYFIFRSG